jgi:hypothetical protein
MITTKDAGTNRSTEPQVAPFSLFHPTTLRPLGPQVLLTSRGVPFKGSAQWSCSLWTTLVRDLEIIRYLHNHTEKDRYRDVPEASAARSWSVVAKGCDGFGSSLTTKPRRRPGFCTCFAKHCTLLLGNINRRRVLAESTRVFTNLLGRHHQRPISAELAVVPGLWHLHAATLKGSWAASACTQRRTVTRTSIRHGKLLHYYSEGRYLYR